MALIFGLLASMTGRTLISFHDNNGTLVKGLVMGISLEDGSGNNYNVQMSDGNTYFVRPLSPKVMVGDKIPYRNMFAEETVGGA